jgi:hypothetical protein
MKSPDELQRAIAAECDTLTTLLAALVAIPTENPPEPVVTMLESQ